MKRCPASQAIAHSFDALNSLNIFLSSSSSSRFCALFLRCSPLKLNRHASQIGTLAARFISFYLPLPLIPLLAPRSPSKCPSFMWIYVVRPVLGSAKLGYLLEIWFFKRVHNVRPIENEAMEKRISFSWMRRHFNWKYAFSVAPKSVFTIFAPRWTRCARIM